MQLDYVETDDTDDEPLDPKKSHDRMGLYFVIFSTVTIIIVLSVYFTTRTDSNSGSDNIVADHIDANNILGHLNNLWSITQSNPAFRGSRSVVNAYNVSAEYIQRVLANSTKDYAIWTQSLLVPVWQQNTNPQIIQSTDRGSITFLNGVDFRTLRDGGNGTFNFEAYIYPIDNYGCDLSDFDVINGKDDAICLIPDLGPCAPYPQRDYSVKAENAAKAGCKAGIVYRNSGETALSNARVRKYGFVYVNGDYVNQLPFFSASYSFYQTVTRYAAYPVRIVQNCTAILASTYNVLAESKGDPANTIVVGAHLDSVAEGPGLNDNGSGSSLILELATLFSSLVPNPLNRIRFVWWGAEEIGSLGAFHYVNSLTAQDKRDIMCNLNFDMMGSPNGIRQVQDPNLYPPEYNITAETLSKSRKIMQFFVSHFAQKSLIWDSASMTGGSDYFPFFVGNIPATGLATGASDVKSMNQRTTYGGLAGAWLDPCYHTPCDTPDNIDVPLMQQIAEAAADVLQQLATNPNPF